MLKVMHMLPRTLLHLNVKAKAKGKTALHGVSKTTFRVMPTDLDVLMHMNNGKYLSLLDIARFEWIARAGLLQTMRQRGWYTVVGSQAITYRKSLQLFQKFTVETKLLGVDERACYIEQRFVRNGEIYARAYVAGRFLKRGGGTLPMSEVAEAIGIDPADFPLPEDLQHFASTLRLPSTRSAAPSVWHN